MLYKLVGFIFNTQWSFWSSIIFIERTSHFVYVIFELDLETVFLIASAFFVGTVLWFLHLFEETERRWQSRNLLITLDRYASDIFRKHPQFEIEIRGKSWSTFCDKLFWKTRCFTALTIELILVQGSLLVQKVMAWILNQSPFLQKYHPCC